MKKNSQEIVVAMTKQSNDTILVAKIISNAWLSYYNWTYPNVTSNDYISSTPTSNYEIIDILNSTMYTKCLTVNSSCAIVIGVIGNASIANATSLFSLTYFNQSNRL